MEGGDRRGVCGRGAGLGGAGPGGARAAPPAFVGAALGAVLGGPPAPRFRSSAGERSRSARHAEGGKEGFSAAEGGNPAWSRFLPTGSAGRFPAGASPLTRGGARSGGGGRRARRAVPHRGRLVPVRYCCCSGHSCGLPGSCVSPLQLSAELGVAVAAAAATEQQVGCGFASCE